MYNILICDDEKDIVSALSIYLSTENYKIFTAYTGKKRWMWWHTTTFI